MESTSAAFPMKLTNYSSYQKCIGMKVMGNLPFLSIVNVPIQVYQHELPSNTATANGTPTSGLFPPSPISPIISTRDWYGRRSCELCISLRPLPSSYVKLDLQPCYLGEVYVCTTAGCCGEVFLTPAQYVLLVCTPTTGCWKRVGFVELPVLDTPTFS